MFDTERLLTAFPALKRQVPMASCTTLRLGGPADLLADPADEAELAALLRAAADEHIPVTVIGHGSNLLVKDGGIRGLVIRIGQSMADIRIDEDRVICGAGVMMGQAAAAAAQAGLAGLAFASGIPGTVGGGVLMNAGAYGGEMAQVVESARVMMPDGAVTIYSNQELAFGYRASRLQETGGIVTQVVLKLTKGSREEILAEMKDLSMRRTEKQPLEYPSAGSTFKRPVGGFAAALIDQCGLKGFMLGGAQVSEKHAGFLLNRGGNARDFLALMEYVADKVEHASGIRLEPEVRIIGEE